MWCFAAMSRNRSMRARNPAASCCHGRSCRNTRIVVMPRPSAHPSSLSIVAGVERVGLPHLELVDGAGRDVVAADQPRLLAYQVLALPRTNADSVQASGSKRAM